MAKDFDAICQRKSTTYLKIPITSTEQIYLIFLIPTLINCIVYIIHFSADLVVATQHFREDNTIWGYCTIAFMYAPAITYFILTVSRPDWWMTDDDKVTKGVCLWFCLQILQLIGFPLFVLYRYAGLIVLTVDAIFLPDKERIKTLNIAAAPAAIELYFFLQAWFQSAPQAIFQTHLLFRQTTLYHNDQSVMIQVLCIMMSIVVLSIETASFQRFESQRVNGRSLPWAMWLKKYHIQELNNLEDRMPLQFQGVNEDITCKQKSNAAHNLVDEITESTIEHRDHPETHTTFDRQISVTPPLPPKNARITPPPTPIRGITTVTPLPVPDEPAPPRPDSIFEVIEQQEIKNEVIRSVPIVELNHFTEDLQIPKRKHSTKGLEEDDPVGKFLAFLWWFFFILARVFAIALFYEFYPFYLIAVLCVHYALMLIYLFYYTKYYDAITCFVNLWLGLIYILSVIEYRIKFKYANRWLLPYYIFVMLQNSLLSLIWYYYAEWDGFWYKYIFFTILVSMMLCVLTTVTYHVLFKPNKYRVYSS